jgi:hypothetical protein
MTDSELNNKQLKVLDALSSGANLTDTAAIFIIETAFAPAPNKLDKPPSILDIPLEALAPPPNPDPPRKNPKTCTKMHKSRIPTAKTGRNQALQRKKY